MDLRKLTKERIEELILINERKLNQPILSNRLKAQLTEVRATLKTALKLKNA